ncbi:MAG: PP2C family protein-serine/threonine phosphatase, partial [Burkholderiales bacterium]
IDRNPRQLTASQRSVLAYLGRLTESLLAEKRLRSVTDALQRETEQDLELARKVLGILTQAGKACERFQHAVLPARKFSGDLVTFAFSPGGQFHGLFADVTGHGLASALYQIPAVDAFKTHVAMGCSTAQIARAINARLNSLAVTGNFMAAHLFCHDARANRLSLWNGGMPDAWLLNEFGEVCDVVRSSHVALGVLPDAAFDASVSTIHESKAVQLLMISDGVLEAANTGNEEFGQDRAKAILLNTPIEDRIEVLLAAVFAHQDCAPEHDDMSVALLNL